MPVKQHKRQRFRASLQFELGILTVGAACVGFTMAWGLLKINISWWAAVCAAVVMALIISHSFAKQLSMLLEQMRNAAQSIADGDYSARIPITRKREDEIVELTHSFNRMAEELQHNDQIRSNMISNVSHELRTPLAALQIMIENMIDGITEPTADNLQLIDAQIRHLSNTTSFLLDLSRIEAGSANLELETLPLADFITSITDALIAADAKHDHQVSTDIPRNLVVQGDRNRLRQLFTNIIANALKHSADHTAILIEARATHPGTVTTHVINFGSQIPPEERSDIFRRFVKGNTDVQSDSGGTGLGLSIARWIAQLHNGSIQVVDDTRGVNFEIVLPQYQQTKAPHASKLKRIQSTLHRQRMQHSGHAAPLSQAQQIQEAQVSQPSQPSQVSQQTPHTQHTAQRNQPTQRIPRP